MSIKQIFNYGPVPTSPQQVEALLSHRRGNMHLLRERPEWLALDPARRIALVGHLASIQERLHLSMQ